MKWWWVGLLFVILSCDAQTLQWPSSLHNPFANHATVTTPTLTTTVIALHYADPSHVKSLLTNKANNLITDNDLVLVQPQQRRLVIQATAAQLKKIKQLVTILDQPQHQLLLKARIVSVDDEFVRDLGVLFTSSKKGIATAGGQLAHSMNNFTMPIANLGNGQLLDVRLKALEKTGHARLVSAPQIVALNEHPATIEAGEEVPYQQETANGGTSIAFKKAVLKLQVTPHILSRQRVLLDLRVNQDKVSALTVQGVPAIHTQQIATQVELKNKQTFVLGGVYETKYSDQHQGIPLLKDIPGLGYLFRTHHRQHDKREMLVFMTVDVL